MGGAGYLIGLLGSGIFFVWVLMKLGSVSIDGSDLHRMASNPNRALATTLQFAAGESNRAPLLIRQGSG